MLETAWETLVERRNILVAGGTRFGKTTLLNTLIGFLPEEARIVAIADTLELDIPRPNWLRFEARAPRGAPRR